MLVGSRDSSLKPLQALMLYFASIKYGGGALLGGGVPDNQICNTLSLSLDLLCSLSTIYFLFKYCKWRRPIVYTKSLEYKVMNACVVTPNHSIKEILFLN